MLFWSCAGFVFFILSAFHLSPVHIRRSFFHFRMTVLGAVDGVSRTDVMSSSYKPCKPWYFASKYFQSTSTKFNNSRSLYLQEWNGLCFHPTCSGVMLFSERNFSMVFCDHVQLQLKCISIGHECYQTSRMSCNRWCISKITSVNSIRQVAWVTMDDAFQNNFCKFDQTSCMSCNGRISK